MAPHTEAGAGLDFSEPSAAAQAGSKKEILIDGKWVDVTSFERKHPGGRVISYLVGTDGSQAFHEFHERSERAKKILKALPSRPDSPSASSSKKEKEVRSLLDDYAALRAQFEKEGLFKPSLGHVMYRIGEIVAMHAVGIYLLNSELPLVLRLAGLVMLGLAQGRCGWFMHEGGHYSLTGYIPLDRTIQEYAYGVGCGMSASWWRSQHNRHHATPQKLQHDVDLDTLPLVAFNEAIVRKLKGKRTPLKIWLSLQGYLFAPVTTFLVAFGWQIFLHPRHIARKRLLNEAIALALRYFFAFRYILASYSMLTAFGLYCAYVWIGAMYIFVNFAVSHTHKPTVDADEHIDWVRYSSNHTTNVTPSLLCDWWMGYLNYQIEHHLFPCMPQFRHPRIAPRVKALFEKHGLVYDVRPYWECVRLTLDNLHQVGNDFYQAAPAAASAKSKKAH